MIKHLNISVLVDDCASSTGFLGEHGLSYWVDTGDHAFLFDTGYGLVLDHNAYLMDIPLNRADAVILSHGHDDHTGGLQSVLRHNPGIRVGVHPHAFTPRYIQEETSTRANGFSRFSPSSIAQEHGQLMLTETPTEILPGVSVTGTIPRTYNVDRINRGYYLDDAGTRPDPFTDEQAVLLDTAAGTVVLVGCSHAGLPNIMEYVADLTGRRRIHAIIGGLHLSDASADIMENVLDLLFEFNVKMLGLAHCTGPEAKAVFRTKFSTRCADISIGTRIRI